MAGLLPVSGMKVNISLKDYHLSWYLGTQKAKAIAKAIISIMLTEITNSSETL